MKMLLTIPTAIIILLVIIFFSIPNGADDVIIWLCLGIYYYYFISSLRKPIFINSYVPTFLNIEILFLSFYYLLFYFPYQTYVLGINDLSENDFLAETFWKYSNVSIIACTIGIVAFMAGIRTRIHTSQFKHSSYIYTFKQYKKLFYGVFLFMILLMIVFSFTGLRAYLMSTYTGSDTGDTTSNGIYFLISFLVLFLFSISIFLYKEYKYINYLFLIIGCLYSIGILVSGDRNTFFIIAVSISAGVFTYIKKIGRFSIFILMVGAVFLYQVVEISRTSDSRGLESVIDAINGNEKSVNTKIDKSSFSITTIATRVAFHAVPNKLNYFFGKFKLIGFAGIIPYSRGLFINPSDKFTTSVDVLIWDVGSTWSLGSSIIADIYLDFGIIGIIILMYILGYFANFVQTKARINNNSIKWSTIYLITISLYSQLSRYSFDFIVRDICWAFFIFFIFNKSFKKIKLINNISTYRL